MMLGRLLCSKVRTLQPKTTGPSVRSGRTLSSDVPSWKNIWTFKERGGATKVTLIEVFDTGSSSGAWGATGDTIVSGALAGDAGPQSKSSAPRNAMVAVYSTSPEIFLIWTLDAARQINHLTGLTDL